MDKCLECNASAAQVDNEHLAACCGLTLQEYAIRHGLSLDVVTPRHLLNREPTGDHPPRAAQVRRKARVALSAVHAAGMLEQRPRLWVVPGEVRRLDQLLWLVQYLQDYGFHFRQSYSLDKRAHRVTAANQLLALHDNLSEADFVEIESLSASEFPLFASILTALCSDFYGGCLFLPVSQRGLAPALARRFKSDFDVETKSLAPVAGDGAYLRTLTTADAQALLGALRPKMSRIPCASERFYQDAPSAVVAKEMVFDSAHFITDHPGKCANLHGGRYNLVVKVKDRVDPYTGFVVDYGYLKAVVQREVIENLDHRHLNFADAALGWRSSTELINFFIWRRLIEYLPNLHELQTYETAQSYCCFQGPSLDEMHEFAEPGASYFTSPALGRSNLRRFLPGGRVVPRLTIVGED